MAVSRSYLTPSRWWFAVAKWHAKLAASLRHLTVCIGDQQTSTESTPPELGSNLTVFRPGNSDPDLTHPTKKPFCQRYRSWSAGHVLMLSIIGFVLYFVFSERTYEQERPSMFRDLQGLQKSIGYNITYRRKIEQPTSKNDLLYSVKEQNFRNSESGAKFPQIQIDQGGQVSAYRSDNSFRSKALSAAKLSDRRFLSYKFNKRPYRQGMSYKTKSNLAKSESVVVDERRTRLQYVEPRASQSTGKRDPTILVWKAMEYQMRNYEKYFEYTSPRECGGCQVTTNRSMVRECAALVHFNSPDLKNRMDVPDPRDRNSNQVYAFWSRETPAKTVHFGDVLKDPQFDPIFNLTINYRLDSDIVDYFGNLQFELRFFGEKQKMNGWFERMMSRKNGLAIWAVSNCNSTYGATKRMQYARSLIKAGLNLTAYGSCFNRRHSAADLVKEFQRHKFYLSLENSVHCPDYVSEKFWRNGLRSGAVPIVWGPTREDVAKVAPDHSYIHTEDFGSPKKLIDYLEYLDKNETAYLEYHAWRFQPVDEAIPYEEVIPTHRSTLCRLCKQVVKRPIHHRIIPSVYEWLYKSHYVDDLCFRS